MLFKNVIENGIKINNSDEDEVKEYNEIFNGNPFGFSYKLENNYFFFCSCGHHFKKHYKDYYASREDLKCCPHCSNKNIYEIDFEDNENAVAYFKNSINIEKIESGFIVNIKQYINDFNFNDISIYKEFDISITLNFKENKLNILCHDSYRITDICSIDDEYIVLKEFLENNYPDIYKYVDDERLDLRGCLLYLCMCAEMPALRIYEISSNNYISKIIKGNTEYFSCFRYSDSAMFQFKPFNMASININDVFDMNSTILKLIPKSFDEEVFTVLQDFSKRTFHFSYIIEFLIKKNLISYNDIIIFMKHFNQLENIDFVDFFNSLFRCSLNENISLYNVLKYYDKYKDEINEFHDFEKVLKLSYIRRLESMNNLEEKNNISKEQFKKIAAHPSLFNFVNIINE